MADVSSDLMYTCSLIEFIGRERRLHRGEVVEQLGRPAVARVYRHADVLHCEHIGSVADAYIELAGIGTGTYDNVAAARYLVPDYWTVGEVFSRLVEDVAGDGREEELTDDDYIDTIMAVYASWITDALSNYNSDFYYQPRDYIRECYRAGDVL